MNKVSISEMILVAAALVLCGVIIAFSAAENSKAVKLSVSYIITVDAYAENAEDTVEDIEIDENNQDFSAQATDGTSKTDKKSVVQATSASKTAKSAALTTAAKTQKSTTAPTTKFNGVLNINTASAEELKMLYGVGDVIAQRIIDYRDENGGFSAIEEIMNVSGIGEKKFEAIKDNITVE